MARKFTKAKLKLTAGDIKKNPDKNIDNVILKIKANERRYTIITVSIILVIFLIVGYIIMTSINHGTVDNSLRNGSLYYEFLETNGQLGDAINLVDVVPLSDGEGLKNEPYKVKITNKGKTTRKYQILVVDDKDMIEFDKCQDIFTNRIYIRYAVNDNDPKNLSSNEEEAVIAGELKPGESVEYKLIFWVSNDYLGMRAPHYHGRILIKQNNN